MTVKRPSGEALNEYSADCSMSFPAEVLIVNGTKGLEDLCTIIWDLYAAPGADECAAGEHHRAKYLIVIERETFVLRVLGNARRLSTNHVLNRSAQIDKIGEISVQKCVR